MTTFQPVKPSADPTPEQRGGALGTKRGDDLKVGDILFFLSTPHRITHFKDYSHPTVTNGEMWRIAYSGDPDDPKCWGMTIDSGYRRYWVA